MEPTNLANTAVLHDSVKNQINWVPVDDKLLTFTKGLEIRSMKLSEHSVLLKKITSGKSQESLKTLIDFTLDLTNKKSNEVPFIDIFKILLYVRELSFGKDKCGFQVACKNYMDDEDGCDWSGPILISPNDFKPYDIKLNESFVIYNDTPTGERKYFRLKTASVRDMLDIDVTSVSDVISVHLDAIGDNEKELVNVGGHNIEYKRALVEQYFDMSAAYDLFDLLINGYSYDNISTIKLKCPKCGREREDNLLKYSYNFFCPVVIR